MMQAATLDKTEVLSKTRGGMDFYKLVMKCDISTRKNYKNPFYSDTKPALSFTYQDGRYFFKDFGDDTYKGDVFCFAGHYYGLNPATQLNDIIKKMAADLHLITSLVLGYMVDI